MEGSIQENFKKKIEDVQKNELPKVAEPDTFKESIQKTGIFDKIIKLFKKSNSDTNPTVIPSELIDEKANNNLILTHSKSPIVSSPEHLVKNYVHVDKSNRVGEDVHVLTHISLNPESICDKDKYFYHYEIGSERDPIVTSKYLEPSGKSKDYNGQDVELPTWIKKGIYVPGEEVINNTNKERFTVVSHIDYNKETGEANYGNMLVKDIIGQIMSFQRDCISLNSPDRSTHRIVNTDKGNKHLHDVKEGDIINHQGDKHSVIYSDPQKGLATVNQRSGQMHFTSVLNYDKPYLSDVKLKTK